MDLQSNHVKKISTKLCTYIYATYRIRRCSGKNGFAYLPL
ncbi:hypothetical protein MNB_SV-12-990 [hydrothermal vent metagenome]|uniref:Uncharacterized protein n=1 Tax=hydrothermal vent metagenome TaxID=652676 RepID=A0A1W1BLZ9_9ZZZZ